MYKSEVFTELDAGSIIAFFMGKPKDQRWPNPNSVEQSALVWTDFCEHIDIYVYMSTWTMVVWNSETNSLVCSANFTHFDRRGFKALRKFFERLRDDARVHYANREDARARKTTRKLLDWVTT